MTIGFDSKTLQLKRRLETTLSIPTWYRWGHWGTIVYSVSGSAAEWSPRSQGLQTQTQSSFYFIGGHFPSLCLGDAGWCLANNPEKNVGLFGRFQMFLSRSGSFCQLGLLFIFLASSSSCIYRMSTYICHYLCHTCNSMYHLLPYSCMFPPSSLSFANGFHSSSSNRKIRFSSFLSFLSSLLSAGKWSSSRSGSWQPPLCSPLIAAN